MKGSPAAFQTQIHNRSEWAGVACGNSRFTGRVGESYERGQVRVQTSLFPHRSDSAVTHCKRVVLMNMLSDHLGDKKQTAFPCFGGIFLANNLLWWNGLSQKTEMPPPCDHQPHAQRRACAWQKSWNAMLLWVTGPDVSLLLLCMMPQMTRNHLCNWLRSAS